MNSIGQADLVKNLHRRGMDGIAAEFPVEILVHFEECDRDTAAGEEKREHDARGPAAYNAARSLRDAYDGTRRNFGLSGGGEAHVFNAPDLDFIGHSEAARWNLAGILIQSQVREKGPEMGSACRAPIRKKEIECCIGPSGSGIASSRR